jgi:hypothetical protein
MTEDKLWMSEKATFAVSEKVAANCAREEL